MGDKPVNFVSWFEAAEVANWLHHGGQTYATTESGSTAMQTGAYTLNRTDKTFTAYKNPGALYWVPNADEWYKAAFYKGGGTDAGYWTYATQSDTAPTAVTASATGVGSAGDAGNYANYNDTAVWGGQASVTTIGTNGGMGTYGTFDMDGNVSEWNSADGLPQARVNRWGGSWTTASNHLANTYTDNIDAATESQSIGFRIAHTAVIVPEPSTWAMCAIGAAIVAMRCRRGRKQH
jgi:formylglycine-generating enzyme required for sulfatase activity